MSKKKIKRIEERIAILEDQVGSLKKMPDPTTVKIEISGVNIGENIKVRRQALGMTQERLADAVGLGRSMVAQIERGRKVPNMVLGRDIARVLGCGMEELLEGEK